MLKRDQAKEIQWLAMKGKAVASLMGTVAVSSECEPEDISMSAYALECYFADILKELERVEADTLLSSDS